jgi:hypothetical protein
VVDTVYDEFSVRLGEVIAVGAIGWPVVFARYSKGRHLQPVKPPLPLQDMP